MSDLTVVQEVNVLPVVTVTQDVLVEPAATVITVGLPSNKGEPGEDGQDGAPGEPGPPGIQWKGLWDWQTTYVLNDVSSYGGAAWISKTTNTNHPCPNYPADWDLFVDKGQPGEPGAPGDVLTAPNGSKWRVTVDNAGVLGTAPI